MRPSIRSRRSVATATLSLLLLLSGCSYWRVHEPGPESLVATRQPSRVKVTTPSTTLVLDGPVIRRDSLYGMVRGMVVGVALSDVTSVAEERSNPVNIGILALGGFALLAAVAASSDDIVQVPNIW